MASALHTPDSMSHVSNAGINLASDHSRAHRSRLSAVSTGLLVTLAGCLSVAFFFRYQILNGFTLLSGDRYDQVIAISIMEHWFNVLRGMAHWSEAGYFYPVPLTLGYNDGYFLYGIVYSLFRWSGFDPYLSGEIVNVCFRTIGFFGFYAAMRCIFGLRTGWSILAAILFTISNNIFLQYVHTQLLSVGLVPVMATLLDRMLRALWSDRLRSLLAWGFAAAVFYACWLLTAFYMAWYFLFFSVFLLAAYVILALRGELKSWWLAIRRHSFALGAIALALVGSCIPFLSVYLPKAHETGMHSYDDALSNTLSLLDVASVGDGNVLYGGIVAHLNHALRPALASFSELTTGFPLALLILFAFGTIFFLRRPSVGSARFTILRAMVVATLITWALTIHIHGHSAWWLIYSFFPGAKGTRVVARYQLFLAAPVIAVAVCYLSAHARRIPGPLLLLICAFLVVEQVNTQANLSLNRPHELARLRAVPQPPSGCEAFFASNARPEGLAGPRLDSIYNHNVDAMLIAETVHLPTINGFATFVPPGWDLVAPGTSTYLNNVRRFAVAHHISALCSLDLKTMQWAHFPLAGSAG